MADLGISVQVVFARRVALGEHGVAGQGESGILQPFVDGLYGVAEPSVGAEAQRFLSLDLA